MNFSKYKTQILILVICVFYVWLRLRNLTDSCLWFDEIFSVHAAGLGWREMFEFVAQDLIHPPLFYALLKIWISIGGESLLSLRLFPVFFSTLALIPFYFLCRELKLRNPLIVFAFLFFAANGALIKYAQEVRMYAVLLCFALFSMWLFTSWRRLSSGFFLLLAVNILLVYTHYFGWFVVAAEIAVTLLFDRDKIRRIFLMLGVLILSFAPWIYAIWRAAQINSDVAQNIGWMSKPNLTVLFQFLLDLIEPFYFQASSAESASRYYISLPVLLILITIKIIFLLNWKSLDATVKSNYILLLIFVKLPILLAFLASWLAPYSIFGTRHLIIVFAPLAILTALMIENLKSQTMRILAISAIFILFAVAFVLEIQRKSQTFIWCAWENFAAGLPKENDNSTKVYVFEDLTAYHLWFALRETGRNYQIVKVNNVKGLIEDKSYFLPRGFGGVQTTDENGLADDEFYIAFRDKDWDLQKPPLLDLKAKGYLIGEPKIFEAQGLKAFLVEIKKGN